MMRKNFISRGLQSNKYGLRRISSDRVWQLDGVELVSPAGIRRVFYCYTLSVGSDSSGVYYGWVPGLSGSHKHKRPDQPL